MVLHLLKSNRALTVLFNRNNIWPLDYKSCFPVPPVFPGYCFIGKKIQTLEISMADSFEIKLLKIICLPVHSHIDFLLRLLQVTVVDLTPYKEK